MTQVEIAEYKFGWMPGYSVSVHSDMLDACKTWCKQLDRHEYHMTKWTAVYEHTFHFERPIVGQNFEMEFKSWVTNQKNGC